MRFAKFISGISLTDGEIVSEIQMVKPIFAPNWCVLYQK